MHPNEIQELEAIVRHYGLGEVLRAIGVVAEPGNIVSSVRVETTPSHDVVRVWNRGGMAGTLVVSKGDGNVIAARLLAKENA